MKKKPLFRIIKHTDSKESYYTLQSKGLLWGWNTVKEEYGMSTSCLMPIKFLSVEEVHEFIDSLAPERLEIVEVIYGNK